MTVDPTTGVGPAAVEPTSPDEDLLVRLSGAIFRDALEGMMVMSYDDGIYLEVNDAFCRMADRTRSEIVARTSAELQIWADPEQRTLLRHRLETEGGFAHTTMRERAELEGGWLRLSPRPEGGTMVECWLPS